MIHLWSTYYVLGIVLSHIIRPVTYTHTQKYSMGKVIETCNNHQFIDEGTEAQTVLEAA